MKGSVELWVYFITSIMAHRLSRREIIKPARTLKKVQVSKETKGWMQCLWTTAKFWAIQITHIFHFFEIHIYIYSHEVSRFSPPLRFASQNLVRVYLSAMCPTWPHCIHLRSFTFSSDSEYKLWTLFCRLLHSHVCFFNSEYSQLLCVKALPIYFLPSRDQISHPYRRKQHVS